jgi:17beta-estradiol 17-dehydrogenase / very-long-chain 3-oxoacyl-CoA reductase
VIAIDLAKATDTDWKRIQQEFNSVKLGMLVNNAGMSHEMPEKFGDADLQRVRDIINVNIVAVNELTRAALPALLKNQAANVRGLILNVGSASGLLPTPLLAVYAASKAYLSSWSTALQREYASAGVDSDCAVAFFVVSNMSKRKKPTALIPTPDAFVRSSLAKVRAHTSPVQ